MGLRALEWEVVDWIYFVQERDQWRALGGCFLTFSRSLLPGVSYYNRN
jgi:hypothetical protein